MYSIVVHADGGNLTYLDAELSDIKYDNSIGSNGFTIGAVAIGAFSFKCPPLAIKAQATYGIYHPLLPRTQCDLYSSGVLLGTYFIDIVKQNLIIDNEDRITISCLDKMAFANKPFDYENGTKICGSNEALTYIANEMGCVIGLANINEFNFDLETEYTQRDVLAMIARASGGNFIMTHGNVLKLVSSNNMPGDLAIGAYKKPSFGAEWNLQQVNVSNGDTQAVVGTAYDDLYKLDVSLGVSDDDVASTANFIFNVCSEYYYIPFKISRAKVPLDTELFYHVPIYSRPDNGVISKPYITQLSMSYTNEQGIDTAYATLSASDTMETRSAFSFDTGRNNAKKDKKLSTVRLGNKYGMKSNYTKTGINTVGAEETSKKYKAQFDKAEIAFTDVTTTETDLGKVYIDDTDLINPSLNMSCKGLKTTAQDVKGAINELFLLGGSGYTINPEWLPLPPALTGEITLLANNIAPVSWYFNEVVTGVQRSCTVDWGDGTVETFTTESSTTHIYADGGYLISNGTKQYIITISDINNTRISSICNSDYGGILLASINCDISTWARMFQSNCELCQVDVLSGTQLPSNFCVGCYSLKVINLCNTISSILDSAFLYCYSLEKINLQDLQLTYLGSQAFQGCDVLAKIDLSKSIITTIYESTFRVCYRLQTIILPSTATLIQVGAFGICTSLSSVNIPAGCVIEGGAFASCTSLHPIPI